MNARTQRPLESIFPYQNWTHESFPEAELFIEPTIRLSTNWSLYFESGTEWTIAAGQMLREERHTSTIRTYTATSIIQRDTNFHDFIINLEIQKTTRTTVCNLCEEVVRPNWNHPQKDYKHVIDCNPYVPHTDPLLFTYEELHKVLSKAIRDAFARRTLFRLPELRVIESPLHPAATYSMPAYQHNRVPIDALTLSEGRNILEFGGIWREEVTRAIREDDA
ncbi:hypothetical protein EDD16DRAFT_1526170 [Pisolithus croceorrhizus]|nr:hypothetical protein EDD16DRAFT_1526170 [Pisolithus croceorrhizus]KAI6117329.1 hypothetical protein EV401DRAFT_1889013 [Pisolithus croceorrhizus]KAI6140937.1 hypothetical protein EDD17DRAFT_1516232 [Pisolithus thermaeus]